MVLETPAERTKLLMVGFTGGEIEELYIITNNIGLYKKGEGTRLFNK